MPLAVNIEVFCILHAIRFKQRVLIDVSTRSLATTVLGGEN
jgi:isopentenyl diphosphate isomerase/L-lactate dehydrogenase-like FMN-dependent dehydrogenase